MWHAALYWNEIIAIINYINLALAAPSWAPRPAASLRARPTARWACSPRAGPPTTSMPASAPRPAPTTRDGARAARSSTPPWWGASPAPNKAFEKPLVRLTQPEKIESISWDSIIFKRFYLHRAFFTFFYVAQNCYFCSKSAWRWYNRLRCGPISGKNAIFFLGGSAGTVVGSVTFGSVILK